MQPEKLLYHFTTDGCESFQDTEFIPGVIPMADADASAMGYDESTSFGVPLSLRCV